MGGLFGGDDRRRRHITGVTVAALLTVAVFAGLALLGDVDEMFVALGDVDLPTLIVAMALVTSAFIVRFLKWELLARTVSVSLTTRASAIVFFSGLMMTITPGKAGELWKAGFATQFGNTSVTRVTAVVGAERFSDLLGLAGLIALGPLVLGRGLLQALAVLGVAGFVVAVIRSNTAWTLAQRALDGLPLADRAVNATDALETSTTALFRLKPMAAATGLSLLAWTLEGLAFVIVLEAVGVAPSIALVLFVYAIGLIAGAVSLLPGGVGATEASHVGLLAAVGYPMAAVTSAVLVVRLATLWYAVALGVLVYLGVQWHSR